MSRYLLALLMCGASVAAQAASCEVDRARALALDEQQFDQDMDRAGWNPYVDATIAFLRKDRVALDKAYAALAAVAPPAGKDVPPVVNGMMEVSMADGQTMKIRWPPNIDVLEGLVQCRDQPYDIAYGSACRPAQ